MCELGEQKWECSEMGFLGLIVVHSSGGFKGQRDGLMVELFVNLCEYQITYLPMHNLCGITLAIDMGRHKRASIVINNHLSDAIDVRVQ